VAALAAAAVLVAGALCAGLLAPAVVTTAVGVLFDPPLEPPHAATPSASAMVARTAEVPADRSELHPVLNIILLLSLSLAGPKHVGFR
jgi:hypothetical protein